MKHYTLFIAFIALHFTNVFAQTDCACCTEEYQRFDFWVGDWIVTDTLGNKVGENHLVKIEDNCILSEHWRGEKGGTGSSYSYYNRLDTTWNQLWVDNKGNILNLKGKPEINKMVLRSALIEGKKGKRYYNKITWSSHEDGTVTQRWEVMDDTNQLIKVVFLGLYARK